MCTHVWTVYNRLRGARVTAMNDNDCFTRQCNGVNCQGFVLLEPQWLQRAINCSSYKRVHKVNSYEEVLFCMKTVGLMRYESTCLRKASSYISYTQIVVYGIKGKRKWISGCPISLLIPWKGINRKITNYSKTRLCWMPRKSVYYATYFHTPLILHRGTFVDAIIKWV